MDDVQDLNWCLFACLIEAKLPTDSRGLVLLMRGEMDDNVLVEVENMRILPSGVLLVVVVCQGSGEFDANAEIIFANRTSADLDQIHPLICLQPQSAFERTSLEGREVTGE